MSTAILTRLIDEHLARHPAMEPRDVYKLLYQGVLGLEHLIASPEDFAARLRAEYEAVSPDEAEPLWEPVHPDGALVRLNLRPFKARGGDVEQFITACLQTAERTWNARGVAGSVGYLRPVVPGGAVGSLPVAGGTGLLRLARGTRLPACPSFCRL